MKANTITLLTALALSAATWTAAAQDQDNRPPRRQGPREGEFRPQRPGGENGPGEFRAPMAPLHAALDANKDGAIDSAEIDNAAAALRKLDKNNDGTLTHEELRPEGRGPRGAGGPPADRPTPPRREANQAGDVRPPVAPLNAVLDANHDQVIDAAEMGNAVAALHTLDKNNDGQLTREEMRPEGRGPRGPGGPNDQREPREPREPRGPRGPQGRPPGE